MEQNPLHSQDLNYGVPPIFNAILDELLDETITLYRSQYEAEGKAQSPVQNQEGETGSTSKRELVKADSLKLDLSKLNKAEEAKQQSDQKKIAVNQGPPSKSKSAHFLKRPSFDANATKEQRFSNLVNDQKLRRGSFLAKSLQTKLNMCPPMTHRVESDSILLSEDEEANMSIEKDAIFARANRGASMRTTRPRQRLISPLSVPELDEEHSNK